MADIDRRLNAALAEHLFEWHYGLLDPILGIDEPVWSDLAGNVYSYPNDWAGTYEGMGQVIEAMQAKGWLLRLNMLPDGSAQVWFSNVSLLVKVPVLIQDTLTVAVGFAALRAVAPEVAEELEGRDG